MRESEHNKRVRPAVAVEMADIMVTGVWRRAPSGSQIRRGGEFQGGLKGGVNKGDASK